MAFRSGVSEAPRELASEPARSNTEASATFLVFPSFFIPFNNRTADVDRIASMLRGALFCFGPRRFLPSTAFFRIR